MESASLIEDTGLQNLDLGMDPNSSAFEPPLIGTRYTTVPRSVTALASAETERFECVGYAQVPIGGTFYLDVCGNRGKRLFRKIEDGSAVQAGGCHHKGGAEYSFPGKNERVWMETGKAMPKHDRFQD
jgi:hypothetical protein